MLHIKLAEWVVRTVTKISYNIQIQIQKQRFVLLFSLKNTYRAFEADDSDATAETTSKEVRQLRLCPFMAVCLFTKHSQNDVNTM